MRSSSKHKTILKKNYAVKEKVQKNSLQQIDNSSINKIWLILKRKIIRENKLFYQKYTKREIQTKQQYR